MNPVISTPSLSITTVFSCFSQSGLSPVPRQSLKRSTASGASSCTGPGTIHFFPSVEVLTPVLTGKTSGSIFIDVGSWVHFGASEIGVTFDAGPIESEAPGGAAFGSGFDAGPCCAAGTASIAAATSPAGPRTRSVNALIVTDASFNVLDSGLRVCLRADDALFRIDQEDPDQSSHPHDSCTHDERRHPVAAAEQRSVDDWRQRCGQRTSHVHDTRHRAAEASADVHWHGPRGTDDP